MCVFEGGKYSGREYSGGKYSGAPCILIAAEPLRCRCTAPTSPGLVGNAQFELYPAASGGETLGSGTVRHTTALRPTRCATHPPHMHTHTHPHTHPPTHTRTHTPGTHPRLRLTTAVDDVAAKTY